MEEEKKVERVPWSDMKKYLNAHKTEIQPHFDQMTDDPSIIPKIELNLP